MNVDSCGSEQVEEGEGWVTLLQQRSLTKKEVAATLLGFAGVGARESVRVGALGDEEVMRAGARPSFVCVRPVV